MRFIGYQGGVYFIARHGEDSEEMDQCCPQQMRLHIYFLKCNVHVPVPKLPVTS